MLHFTDRDIVFFSRLGAIYRKNYPCHFRRKKWHTLKVQKISALLRCGGAPLVPCWTFFIKGEITLRIQISSVQLSASLKEGLPLHDAIFTGHCKKERDLNILGGWHILAATVEQKD